MATLAADPEVIALALHVDYWDYIGWKDTFANPAFTKRQKAYAHAIGSRTIYTPQMIVAGDDRVEGNDPMAVSEKVRKHAMAKSQVTLSVERSGAKVVIRAVATPPLTTKARVQIVRYLPEETVEIGRGENAGRAVTYHNIVTSWVDIGEWAGADALEMTADAAGSEPVVVILQAEGFGRILAAANLR